MRILDTLVGFFFWCFFLVGVIVGILVDFQGALDASQGIASTLDTHKFHGASPGQASHGKGRAHLWSKRDEQMFANHVIQDLS